MSEIFDYFDQKTLVDYENNTNQTKDEFFSEHPDLIPMYNALHYIGFKFKFKDDAEDHNPITTDTEVTEDGKE